MIDTIATFFNNVINGILSLLPDSPFQYVTQTGFIYKYLQIVNYFIPVSFILSSLEAWLVCYSIYLVISVILRWAKAID